MTNTFIPREVSSSMFCSYQDMTAESPVHRSCWARKHWKSLPWMPWLQTHPSCPPWRVSCSQASWQRGPRVAQEVWKHQPGVKAKTGGGDSHEGGWGRSNHWRDPESGHAWRTQPSPPRQVIRSDLPTPQSPSEADGVDFKSICKGTGRGSPSSPVPASAPQAPHWPCWYWRLASLSWASSLGSSRSFLTICWPHIIVLAESSQDESLSSSSSP